MTVAPADRVDNPSIPDHCCSCDLRNAGDPHTVVVRSKDPRVEEEDDGMASAEA